MADNTDWRASLTASERYDNVTKLQDAIEAGSIPGEQRSGFEVENEAYKTSASREQYDAVCSHFSDHRTSGGRPESPPFEVMKNEGGDNDDGTGIRLGPYNGCHYIASGVTAEVYRCKDRALKVITETGDIEPHNPLREARILADLRKPCIPLLETFRDQEQRFTLVFPYMPLTLADLLEHGSLANFRIRAIFKDLFTALADLHREGIIHRDVKPSAILLASPDGPAYLSDFGTAWHPRYSIQTEPAGGKILDIGTGPYRAPEALFGDQSYGASVDMWAAGAMLAECARHPPKPLFESRAAHEDGNQLGLILSVFKTIGTPTRETWPEAVHFRTPPFDMYTVFEQRPWHEILPDVDEDWRALVARLVRYDSKRATAEQVLDFHAIKTLEQIS